MSRWLERMRRRALKGTKAWPPARPLGRQHVVVSILSGRFDAADAAVADDWRGERRSSSLLLGTEVAHRDAATLDGGDEDFELLHVSGAGKGENAAEFRRSVWHLLRSFYLPVLEGGGAGRFSTDAFALVAILEHVTGQRLVLIQNHDPAHNLKSSRFWHPGNMRRWLAVKRAEGAAMRRLEAAYPDAIYLVTGDANAPQGARWFLRAMGRFFPGFRNGGGFEFGALWVKGAHAAWHRTVKARGSDHEIRRVGLTW